MDLYRLGEGGSGGKEAAASSLGRLQLDEAFTGAVSLVEWPERLPEAMVPKRRVELRCVQQQHRWMRVSTNAGECTRASCHVTDTPPLSAQTDHPGRGAAKRR